MYNTIRIRAWRRDAGENRMKKENAVRFLFISIYNEANMSPTYIGCGYRIRYPTGGEHVSRLVETLG
jgi:hypothetical protein